MDSQTSGSVSVEILGKVNDAQWISEAKRGAQLVQQHAGGGPRFNVTATANSAATASSLFGAGAFVGTTGGGQLMPFGGGRMSGVAPVAQSAAVPPAMSGANGVPTPPGTPGRPGARTGGMWGIGTGAYLGGLFGLHEVALASQAASAGDISTRSSRTGTKTRTARPGTSHRHRHPSPDSRTSIKRTACSTRSPACRATPLRALRRRGNNPQGAGLLPAHRPR